MGVCGGILAGLAAGCSAQSTYRDDAAKQNAVEAQLRDQQLAPVLGTYCGNVTLAKSGRPFRILIIMSRGEDNIHSPQSSDPTLTARVPKIAGSLQLPALDDSGYSSAPELVNAMGGLGALPFDNGDYNPANQQIYLPFNVPSHQGEYGEVRGTFNNGRFTGTWFSESYQTIGDFDVSLGNIKQCDPSQDVAGGGASS